MLFLLKHIFLKFTILKRKAKYRNEFYTNVCLCIRLASGLYTGWAITEMSQTELIEGTDGTADYPYPARLNHVKCVLFGICLV